MLLVVDANVVISALVVKGIPYKVFFFNSLFKRFDLIAPDLLWREVDKRKPSLLEEIKLSAGEVEELLEFLKEEIDVVPAKEFVGLLPEAERVSPDPKDKQYFALALAFNCGLFSGDPELKEQSVVKVYSPRELLDILMGKSKS